MNEDESCDDVNPKTDDDDDDEEIKYKGVSSAANLDQENGVTLDKENPLNKLTKNPYKRKKRHTESDDDI